MVQLFQGGIRVTMIAAVVFLSWPVEQPDEPQQDPVYEAVYEIDNTVKGLHASNLTHMGYKSITSKTSLQYQLQQFGFTDPSSGVRIVDCRYCIAVGTGFDAPVGSYIDVYFEDGDMLSCIVADIKAAVDTDDSNTYCVHDGSVVEFVVDNDVYDGVTGLPVVEEGDKNAGAVKYLCVYPGNFFDEERELKVL